MSTPNQYPPYSFVQDTSIDSASDCYTDPQMYLPLSSWNNLACQVTIPDVSAATSYLSFVPGGYAQMYLAPVPLDFDCTLVFADPDNPTTANPVYHHHAAIYCILAGYSGTGATLNFDYGNDSGDMDLTTATNNIIALPVGTCFKFAIVWDIYTASNVFIFRFYFGCTNAFKRINPNECYTSVLLYNNPSDAFGFQYTGLPITLYNVVELPMYLRDPVMENDQKVYTKSNGDIVKLYERKEEIFTLETDLIPYRWHKNLDVALSHDTVYINNPNAASFDPLNTAFYFAKKENYAIEYEKAPLSSFGKGTCKLSNATPVSLINNNCG